VNTENLPPTPAGRKERIRERLILPFSLLMMLILLLGLYGGYRLQQYHLNAEVDAKMAGVDTLFTQFLSEEAKFMEAQLDFLVKDKEILAAWQQRNRDALYKAADPIYQKIRQDYAVTHFYFIDPAKICFLRVHMPSRHGDVITRYTMQRAATSGRQTYGIELGPLGTFTLRVVRPWKIDGKLIGYLELGEEIGHLTGQLKKTSGLDLLFTIDKSRLDRKKWEDGLKILDREEQWDDFDKFVIIDKTLGGVTPSLKNFLLRSQQDIDISNKNIEINDHIFRLATLPLVDAGNNTVGRLVALDDITGKIALLKNLLLMIMSVLLIASLAVLAFFYRYAGRIENRLTGYQDHLEGLVAERTKKLQQALEEVKALSGLLPICSFCKKIRDDQGYWNQLESYISKHSEAKFSHSICDDCMKKHYPELDVDDRGK